MTLRNTTAAMVIAASLALTAGLARGGEAKIPHLDANGHAGYAEYMAAPAHSAFAIAPGGAWAWVSGAASPDEAEESAIKACAETGGQTCHLYSADGQIVFNHEQWTQSWVREPDAAAAGKTGTAIGMNFPDMALSAPDGGAVSLSDFRGSVVFLHFWGSWCPPCQTEFPELQSLYNDMADDGAVRFVLVQAREPIEISREWKKRNGINMPLYDSGHRGRGDGGFRLSDGSTIPNRELASVYPSTYVLDTQGRVAFHKAGPGHGWPDYAPLLRALAANR